MLVLNLGAGIRGLGSGLSALRDGNRAAIPDEFLPKDYRPPGFRIGKDDAAAAAAAGKKD